ncbi:glycoside hydrolase family 65 [Paenibacillus sp. FSL H7-0326]|uniref:glycoside hydrolase family 65 n=1 Tax=Paenibacillus sp. FSL H7-0326 TaxID=1921144 RepID=UPI00096DA7FA|nr:glycoside hydrolase family 65 [Paenibacillus sp. FSL H7-0326]OMC72229.1 glycoside hydrolase family 65 [Paenibacillus sp. FSL H7-0326]
MQKIDRKSLVTRHNPVLRQAETLSPLSVGNGEFAYTVDITGMQSFPEEYKFPLGTQSNWGWHSTGGHDLYRYEDVKLRSFETHGRQVGYATDAAGQEEVFHWLRQNPHRVQLGVIGLELLSSEGSRIRLQDIGDIEQELDLWTGIITSRFRVEGVPVTVLTSCHDRLDQIGLTVESELIEQGRLFVSVRFPAPHPQSRGWGSSIGLNWETEEGHKSELYHADQHGAEIRRIMDEDKYVVKLAWTDGELVQLGRHAYRLVPNSSLSKLDLTFSYALSADEVKELANAEAIRSFSTVHWEQFWKSGGAIELAGSRDPRAAELERRIILSQYQTALHSAGTIPPQETGLMYNSWFGKPHLEMHWWHAAHFAQWGRIHLLERSLSWYQRILPKARELAGSQGYTGARWPKMVGPEGNQSPSSVATLLIWQQPHPIDLAYLCYQADPSETVLERYKEMVMETAEFMASFAVWDEPGQRYVLGPPVIPAQENHRGSETMNPVYELEYWRHGLEIALLWRERLGLPDEPKWRHVLEHLSVPEPVNGVYEAHELCTDTYTRANIDHPSMLAALGVLPGKLIDRSVMLSTLHRVREAWRWETSWGWDFPTAAMTAARLGEGDLAVDMLLMDQVKNTYLKNGHNYQRDDLLAYLPGNGGLLAAVALMAAGWIDGPYGDAPGFPQDGSWTVKLEGLVQRL